MFYFSLLVFSRPCGLSTCSHYDDNDAVTRKDQPMFTVDREQYFDHEYNPNKSRDGIAPFAVSTLIPPLRGVGAATKGIGVKISHQYSPKIQNAHHPFKL